MKLSRISLLSCDISRNEERGKEDTESLILASLWFQDPEQIVYGGLPACPGNVNKTKVTQPNCRTQLSQQAAGSCVAAFTEMYKSSDTNCSLAASVSRI